MKQPMDHQPKAEHPRTAKPGTPIQRAIAAYRNRSVLTAARYLASLGADSETIRRYASSFGRKVAQAYRSATGQEPVQSGWAVAHHRLIPVYGYQREDAEILRHAAASYPKTSFLLNTGA